MPEIIEYPESWEFFENHVRIHFANGTSNCMSWDRATSMAGSINAEQQIRTPDKPKTGEEPS